MLEKEIDIVYFGSLLEEDNMVEKDSKLESKEFTAIVSWEVMSTKVVKWKF